MDDINDMDSIDERPKIVSVAPKYFRSRLEELLKPRWEEGREEMTEFEKEQEYRYKKAYECHKNGDNRECYDKLVKTENFMKEELDGTERRDVSQDEDTWRFIFNAKCCLFFATFHHDKDIVSKLRNFGNEVGRRYALDDLYDWQRENLIEIEALCDEMPRRISIEQDLKIFPEEQGFRPRMTDTWLEQTKGGSRMEHGTVTAWLSNISDE
ncbi:MAG: hypothetical protein Q9223_000818 [Gallowayella weberi]